jgi:hypothetical protein
MDTYINPNSLNAKEKTTTKKFKIKDVFDKKTYPKGKSNKVIAIVKKKV